MAEVSLHINGRQYRIGCDPGEEERVAQLGEYIDKQVRSVAGPGVQASDAHLLVLGSIIMCDELFELKDMLAQAQNQYNAVSQKLESVSEELEYLQSNGSSSDTRDSFDDDEVADIIANLATRIENIADRLQKT